MRNKFLTTSVLGKLACKASSYLSDRKYKQIDANSVVINSVPKSGTNWMRLFLCNYISQVYGDQKVINFDHLLKICPCREHIVADNGSGVSNYKKFMTSAEIFSANTPYKRFLYGHSSSSLKRRLWSKLIFCYRHPLDVVVSRYFYSYKKRPTKKTFTHILPS